MLTAPVSARAFVQPGPAGQLQVALPGVSRSPYVTGLQVRCEPCAAAGRHTLGMPRDGADSEALCVPCWRARQERAERRRRRELQARLWEGLGEAEAAACCAACGEPDPSPACWLCGYSWLAEARAAYEAELVVEAAAAELEFVRVAELAQAQAEVAHLLRWIERCRTAVEDFATGGSKGRPVVLLADLLARDAATRTSARGRPGVLADVCAVLALDADWRSGRRSRPGRAVTAALVGCTERAVTEAWKRAGALNWCTRTHQGGRVSAEQRRQTRRWNNRAEFDVVAVHRGDRDAAAEQTPRALQVFGELLDNALQVLAAAEARVDALKARSGGVSDWATQARRTQLRAAVAGTRAQVTDTIPALQIAANYFTPHMVSTGKRFTSGSYWGLSFHQPNMINTPVEGRVRPRSGRGNGEGGASRSSTQASRGDLGGCGESGVRRRGPQPLARPRTGKEAGPTSPPRPPRRRPAWAGWAYELAAQLCGHWAWLRAAPRPLVAAVLGSRLGSTWTAAAVVDFLTQARGGRELPVVVHSPVALLRRLLDQALTGDAEPPHVARRTVEHRQALTAARRAAVAAEAQQARTATAAARVAHAERAQAAAVARTSGAGLPAARAAVAAATGRHHR